MYHLNKRNQIPAKKTYEMNNRMNRDKWSHHSRKRRSLINCILKDTRGIACNRVRSIIATSNSIFSSSSIYDHFSTVCQQWPITLAFRWPIVGQKVNQLTLYTHTVDWTGVRVHVWSIGQAAFQKGTQAENNSFWIYRLGGESSGIYGVWRPPIRVRDATNQDDSRRIMRPFEMYDENSTATVSCEKRSNSFENLYFRELHNRNEGTKEFYISSRVSNCY